MITFYNYTKAQKIKEQQEHSKADNKKDNESDHDYENQIKVTGIDQSEVGHTLVTPGGQDNLRRRKVKYKLGEEVTENPAAKELAKANLAAKHAKEKESLASKHEQEKEQIKEAEYTGKGAGKPGWMLRADPKLAMALKKAKERRKFVAGTPTKTNESLEESHVEFRIDNRDKVSGDHKPTFAAHDAKVSDTTDKATYVKVPSHKADSFKSAMKSKHGVRVELAESALERFRAASAEREKKHDEIERKRKEDAAQGKENMSGAIDRLEKSLKQESPSTLSKKPFDPFFEETSEYDQTIEVATPDTALETSEEDDVDDKEIEAMIGNLSDEEIMDEYGEDELGLVDDETGEEIPKSDEEDALDEESLMEVLSRVERMKAKFRIRRTAAKRERATKIALKRYSNTATINKRARRLAIKLMKKRLLRGRDVSKLSVGEKERIERTLEQRKALIGRIATRLAPRVRKVEKARMSHTKFTQGSQPSVF
jgi:hypothetical protein